MELSAADLWVQTLELAKSQVPEQGYQTWLKPTVAIGLTDSALIVEAPSEFHAQWVDDKFGATLRGLIPRVLGRPLEIRWQASDGGPQIQFPSLDARQGMVQPPSPGPTRSAPVSDHGLNERYTFDRFVVGSNNELAAAACHAVAEKPAQAYNPLFLYGGVGLGKTHLMHAVGIEILQRDPTFRVAYVTSERFMNELVVAIQESTTAAFRRRYREMDLLLVDDIHFLEGKERTQEEFFHTFNAIYESHKQIVITSDRPPKDMPGLEERLVSRFEWGLVADIRPPDYETRMAILSKKASLDGHDLDEDVIDFVARSCRSSVRELEGALIKLLAYSSLTRQDITLPLARKALTGMFGASGSAKHVDRPNLPSPRAIRSAVAEAWGVSPEALQSKRRTRDLTVPRQVAMYLIREILDHSLVQIGTYFGGRDHSTVIHSIRKVEHELLHDTGLKSRIDALKSDLAPT